VSGGKIVSALATRTFDKGAGRFELLAVSQE